DGIRAFHVTGVQTCALPISPASAGSGCPGARAARPVRHGPASSRARRRRCCPAWRSRPPARTGPDAAGRRRRRQAPSPSATGSPRRTRRRRRRPARCAAVRTIRTDGTGGLPSRPGVYGCARIAPPVRRPDARIQAIMHTHYLKRILTARVYDVAFEVPLEPAPVLSARHGNRILLKREVLQPVFSFKLRGAYNKMASLGPKELARGVITASAGNHAQGVALAARTLGCRAVIVMPVTTPQLKIDAVASHGAEIVLHGESYSDASLHARELQAREELTYVHAFDDPDVIAGQGTIGMEILRQHQGPIEAIFVPIGGGGLISGIAAYVKQIKPEIRIVGVQTVDSDAMARSVRAGRRVELHDVGLFSDGTAVKKVGAETFRLVRHFVDEIITVDTDAVCAAIKDVFTDTRSIPEAAGALAIAGAKAYVAREGIRD